MATSSVALLGRTSAFGKSRSLTWAKGDADSVADMTVMDAAPQVASKIACCELSVSPSSTTTVTPLTSFGAETPLEISPPSVVEASSSTEDGEESDVDTGYEVRLPCMRLRTDSCIGMPVWGLSPSSSSRSCANAAIDMTMAGWPAMYSDACSFGMPASHVSTIPASMPIMPAATPPSMPTVMLQMMLPPATQPAMESYASLCTSYDHGHSHGDQAYSHVSPNSDWCSRGGVECDRQISQAPSLQEESKSAWGAATFGQRLHTAVEKLNQKPLRTTICFRNLPNNYSTKMVLSLLDNSGFKDLYDFIYVPHDFKRLPALVNVGYFFVNFISHDIAVAALAKLVGFKRWEVRSNKVLEGTWAAKTQGKSACRERCKYFTFLHEDIPSECKPMLLEKQVDDDSRYYSRAIGCENRD